MQHESPGDSRKERKAIRKSIKVAPGSHKSRKDFLNLTSEDIQYTPLSRTDFNMEVKNRWYEIRTKHPPKRRSFHSSFHHMNYLYILGGQDILEGKLNDIHRISLVDSIPNWERVTPTGDELERIAYHSGEICNGIYFLIGGQNSELDATNDVYVYDVEKNHLERMRVKEKDLPQLEGHTCTLYGADIIIFGGFSKGHRKNTVYSFDCTARNFLNLSLKSKSEVVPPPRTNHAAVVYKDSLCVFGGESEEGAYLNDFWMFDLIKFEWTQVIYADPENIPKPRSGHSMNVHNDMIYIFGGKTGNIKETNELWKFNPNPEYCSFVLLHDTLIEQYSKKELESQIPAQVTENENQKTFRILSKRDVENKENPLLNFKKEAKNPKKCNDTLRKSQMIFEFKQNVESEIVKSPKVSKMSKSTIYNLDTDMALLQNRLHTLSSANKMMSGIDTVSVEGLLPMPRDGHSALVFSDLIVVFGGDRNKFPFNDLHLFNIS